ncbi:hypothetical protein GCM10010439_16900 [Actinocorallia aurantiaca]|uniref:Guanylate cyclase domain-containing protein n=1 Tax=Actinocorallia aurantiaca TaxID=46204 RepID=A0ABP6GJU6_9ACTN
MGEEKAGSPAARRRRARRLWASALVVLTNGTAFYGGAAMREPRLAIPALVLVLLWSTACIGPFAWIQLTLFRRAAELATSAEEVRHLMDLVTLAFVRAFSRPALLADRFTGPRPRFAGQHASILFVDIVGFGSLARTDADREVVHEALYDIVRLACTRAGIPWPRCHLEDRGDGMLMVLPLLTPTGNALSPFLFPLAELLREHNLRSTEGTRIQLRVVLHVGPVKSASYGVMGEAIIRAARLLDAPSAKEEQRRSGADLTFVASSTVYETIIKHSQDELSPASYRRITARVKESEVTGWLCLLGMERRALLLDLDDPIQLLPRRYGVDRLAEELA